MSDLAPLPTIAPGRYRHYKGGEYDVLGVVRHSESLEPLVLYRPLKGDSGTWVRPHAMFLEQVEVDGQKRPRFERIADAPDEAFFRALERERTRALVARDMPTLERLHASDYRLVTPNGKAVDRAGYLGQIAAAPFYAGWECGEMQMRISPDVALLRYPATLSFPSGKEVACWHFDAYERRGDAWQVVWSQVTEIRAPA